MVRENAGEIRLCLLTLGKMLRILGFFFWRFGENVGEIRFCFWRLGKMLGKFDFAFGG